MLVGVGPTTVMNSCPQNKYTLYSVLMGTRRVAALVQKYYFKGNVTVYASILVLKQWPYGNLLVFMNPFESHLLQLLQVLQASHCEPNMISNCM